MKKKNLFSVLVGAGLTLNSMAPLMTVYAEQENAVQDSSEQVEGITGAQQNEDLGLTEPSTSTTTQTEETMAETEDTASEETVESDEATDEVEGNDEYTEPAPSSRSDLAVASRSLARATIDKVTAGETNRPTLSFIDVSSHNGTITTSQYQMMKTYGVGGVVVKLTEGTTYFNPYAQSQIANAKAAGLKVSVYHYSHYTSADGARAEAAYFASKAASLSLAKDTVMVNDIEETAMRTSALNNNTLAFKQQLNSSGYNTVAYYLSRSWLDVDGGVFSTSTFGKNVTWVAQYPYTPTASQNWNSDYSSWQWSSNFYFPGISHPFDVNTDYTGLFTGDAGDRWDESIPVTGSLSITDPTSKETTFKATATVEAGGYAPYRVMFPTWSNANGQDDIIWYEGTRNSDGTWSADIDISKHNSTGGYTTHAYVQMLPYSSARMYLSAGSFSVSPIDMTAAISNYSKEKGTFDVTVTANHVSGTSKVRVAAWSESNQGDIYWYDAIRQSDGSYKVVVDVKNHKYNSGKYFVHSFAYAGNGLSRGVALDQQVEVNGPSASVTFTDTKKTETTYLASSTVSPGSLGSIKEVRYAVWSVAGGQDDIQWYTAKLTNGKYEATIDINKHKTAGAYTVHTYVVSSAGLLKWASADSFTVSTPTASVTSANYVQNKGTFDIIVTASAPAGIKEVDVPVWSKSNQSDIKWYRAAKQSDGTYKVTVNIKDHQYNAGSYQAHAYVRTNNSLTRVVGMASLNVTAPAITGTLNVIPNSTETTYTAKLNADMGIYGTPKEVQFAVWSQKNGQDDIQWYSAKKNSDGTYSFDISIAKHKDAGVYSIHAYATLSNGTKKIVTASTFTVTDPTITTSVSAYDKTSKSFTVTVNGSSKSGISKVRVPVWSKSDQSDIQWYDAVKQSDGTYKVTVNISKHGNNTGNYNIHVYLYAGNGITKVAGAPSVNVTN
ncbi:GBS Bsp-like repeat-containing protein [Enterococcus sp. BWR-S5]|uniref:GBS Bsp-like repeat-containing protein n=1 Tax=Enterococcus sp. BWR-S5 TaxID=2787714 RepID=UPI001921C2F7|nr:GBS Bsp-like repeat-containing protein [Enterococcus sp. BWR-S5]MBL1223877.1 GBS Bsp-like repeat-containing protein [Enterococcus sp. BWR-S5]